MYHKLQHHTIPKLLQLKKQPMKLYLALCQYAKIGDGVCWPSKARLGRECKITSGRDMKLAIKSLEDMGLLVTWKEGKTYYFQVFD